MAEFCAQLCFKQKAQDMSADLSGTDIHGSLLDWKLQWMHLPIIQQNLRVNFILLWEPQKRA